MLSLRDMIAEETARPVHEAAAAVTEAIVARHGDGLRAVLFYGAGLRDGADVPDGPAADELLARFLFVPARAAADRTVQPVFARCSVSSVR